jgi:hypothetical protein
VNVDQALTWAPDESPIDFLDTLVQALREDASAAVVEMSANKYAALGEGLVSLKVTFPKGPKK